MGVKRDAERAAEKALLHRRIGERVRWVREAYEAKQPLHHSQTQWAQALRISVEMMNRIELGKCTPGWDVMARISGFCGVGMDYFVFGAVDAVGVKPWLYQALMTAHPKVLLDRAHWLESREFHVQTTLARAARKGAGRGPYRRAATT